MKRWWMVLLVLTIFLSGCAGSIRDLEPPDAGLGLIVLEVDWAYVDALWRASWDPSLPAPNKVGVRLVAQKPDGSEVVSLSSLSRNEGDSSITVSVSPRDELQLKLIVLHHPTVWEEGGNYLYYVAGLGNLQVQSGQISTYTLQEVELINPSEEWELIPPWDSLLHQETLELPGGKEYFFQWRWRDGAPLPDPRLPSLLGNFGRQMEDGGWYDFGTGPQGTGFQAPASGEWQVGFLIWVPGDRYGLGVTYYGLPNTVRGGRDANTRWTLRFVEEQK